MGVIPKGAGLLGDKPVAELTTDRHRILSHTRHPIHEACLPLSGLRTL